MPMGLSLLLLLCLKGRQSEKEQQNRLKDEERCVKLMHIKDVGGGPFGRGLRSMKMTSKPTRVALWLIKKTSVSQVKHLHLITPALRKLKSVCKCLMNLY